MSLVFYDTETTGIASHYDQILQFAAIKTDPEFNELERFEVRSRLLPYVVPSPEAMRTNRIRAERLLDPALPSHYEMMCSIQGILSRWSPSTFLGYNSLRFDEDLVRQGLYKTLHQPYLTNTNGNTRSDVLRIVQAASVFAPEAIVVPTGGEGHQVFKLDQIAPANGFSPKMPHEAMNDVEATIFLCRLVAERASDVWSTFMRFSNKAAVVDFITSEPAFCWTDFYFGRAFGCLATAIGQNAEYSNEWYIYDLSVAPEELGNLTDDELNARLREQPKPIRRLRTNAIPMLSRQMMRPQTAAAWSVDGQNSTAVPGFFSRIRGYATAWLSLSKVSKGSFHRRLMSNDKSMMGSSILTLHA